ncbi:amidohydrolase family protein, partial [Steroidobacter sp.]|uniref:amidohydrolase family protein n=1 Tax=Steroidobacter sp. TaxID=1978227 RepID=UPI001A3D61B7
MRLSLIVSALLSLPMLCFNVAAAPRHFDVLIRGGEIVDGSGSPRYRADIAIKGDEIVAIGRFDDAKADRIIDARNKVVTPGFIDMHAHIADAGRSRRASALLSDDRRLRA